MYKFLLIITLILFNHIVEAQSPLKKLIRKHASGFGPELVTNGDFASGASWTLEDGCTISGGEAIVNSSSAFAQFLYQSIAVVNTHTYKIEFDVTNYSSGIFHVGLGDISSGVFSGDINSNGHQNFNLTLNNVLAPLQIIFFAWTPVPVCHIDNVSVKEVL